MNGVARTGFSSHKKRDQHKTSLFGDPVFVDHALSYPPSKVKNSLSH
jgi:hypothetical protein